MSQIILTYFCNKKGAETICFSTFAFHGYSLPYFQKKSRQEYDQKKIRFLFVFRKYYNTFFLDRK